MTHTAAILAAVLFGGLAVLQLLLAAGLPLGRFAWGGGHEVLPTRLRVGSAVGIVLYAFFILLVLDRVGLVEVFGRAGWTTVALWAVTVYLFLNIPLNALSKSKAERALMTPTVAVLALLFLYIALNT
jgi:hypothetical protein